MKRRLARALMTIRLHLWTRRRYQRLVLEDVDGLALLVLPNVFNPVLLRSGKFFERHVSSRGMLRSGSRVLDLGCGSGIGAIAAARAGCAVVAVDINPDAVRCTRINALLNNVEAHVQARCGDLFESVAGERFDLVLFNPPYYRGTPRDGLDRAWRSPDIIERFAAGLEEHLTADGYALIVLSSDGEPRAFLDALEAAGLDCRIAQRRDFGNEVMTIHSVSRGPSRSVVRGQKLEAYAAC